MNFDNTHIFKQALSIADAEFDECKKFGEEMVEFTKKNKYICLAANQVGSDKKMCVIMNHLFFNPVVVPKTATQSAEGIAIEVSKPVIPQAVNILSFPGKRVMIPLCDEVKVSVYSVEDEDRSEEFFNGELAMMWQVINYCLNGVKEADIVAQDYLTIKSEGPKKKPNDKCPKCGRKNKKCLC